MNRVARNIPAVLGLLVIYGLVSNPVGVFGQSSGQPSTENGEWPSYTGDVRGSRYSPLDQIDATNFNELEVAWRFKTDNLGHRAEYKLEGTPLMIGGVLYTTAGTRRAAIALDAKTGELSGCTACVKAVSVALPVLLGGSLAAQTSSSGRRTSDDVIPFEINLDDALLEDLHERLVRARLPDQLDGAGWDYGTDLAYLKQLVDYWRTKFDWRKQERKLNEFPQFTTDIDGLDVHFIHVRSKHENALPLVLAHGWPDTVFGFQKVIGPLTDPEAHGGAAEDAFHVVCPSMMGYGFSDKPTERGWNVDRMGEVAKELMAKLGYTRYGAQGGDWGSAVTSWLGRNDPEHVVGIHVNLVGVGPPDGMENPEEGIPEWELKRTKDRREWWDGENAYFQIQGTKPQTLGYGLNDSPTGLAAWIIEKWRTWADTGGDIESRFTKDELLTNIMIYWATASITSSTRIYYETRHNPRNRGRVEVPTAIAIFPTEIFFAPRKWVEGWYNVQQWTEMPRGGHFAAMEEPELYVEDVRKFFRELR